MFELVKISILMVAIEMTPRSKFMTENYHQRRVQMLNLVLCYSPIVWSSNSRTCNSSRINHRWYSLHRHDFRTQIRTFKYRQYVKVIRQICTGFQNGKPRRTFGYPLCYIIYPSWVYETYSRI